MANTPSTASSGPGRIAVSIVNYGTSGLVLEGLPALMRELARCERRHVAIVDNCSPGGDGARLEAGVAAMAPGPDVEVIRSPVNGGFAAGNNLAFAALRALDWTPDAVLLLNPDAEICEGALGEMLAVMRAHPAAGFVGPRLVNPDGSTWVAAFHFPTLASQFFGSLGIGALGRLFPTLAPDVSEPIRVDWVSGAAILIRWQALEAVGDMDDGYFLYYDEVDYMFQGRRLGWESWHAPAARVRHEAGAATGIQDGQARQGRLPAYWYQSWARYFAKNHGPLYARAAGALKLAAMLFAHLHRRLRAKPVTLSDRFYYDFATKVVLARLSPPPASPLARSAERRP